MKIRVLLAVLTLCITTATHADAPAPVLTMMQKAQIQLRIKEIENAQLRLELARYAAQELLQSLEQPGYRLDIQKLVYVAEPKTEGAK